MKFKLVEDIAFNDINDMLDFNGKQNKKHGKHSIPITGMGNPEEEIKFFNHINGTDADTSEVSAGGESAAEGCCAEGCCAEGCTESEFLEEDLELDLAIDFTNITTIISDLIATGYASIEHYNSAIIQLNQNQIATDLLKELKEAEFTHIGKLEQLLKTLVPESNKIDQGMLEVASETSVVEPDNAHLSSIAEEPAEEPAVLSSSNSVEDILAKLNEELPEVTFDKEKNTFMLGDMEVVSPEDAEEWNESADEVDICDETFCVDWIDVNDLSHHECVIANSEKDAADKVKRLNGSYVYHIVGVKEIK